MNKIQVAVIQSPSVNPVAMTSLAARLTQQKVKDMDDLKTLMAKNPSEKLVHSVQAMKHESVTRHAVWTIAITGASRRFLAQIRTHSVGVDFTSASLQYQNMSGSFDCVVPYKVLEACEREQGIWPLQQYRAMCRATFDNYEEAVELFEDGDTAGYVSCQASRNVILMTANTEAWRNIIEKRSCNRNTQETQYVTFLIWRALLQEPGGQFMFGSAGPECLQDYGCRQRHMSCGAPMSYYSKTIEFVDSTIATRWPLLKKEW
jgi:thymidylate synthase (FAD)